MNHMKYVIWSKLVIEYHKKIKDLNLGQAPIEIVTRWNSTYNVIFKHSELKEFFENKCFRFSNKFWDKVFLFIEMSIGHQTI